MTVYAVEHHQQVYAIWRQLGLRGLAVTHVDFHCDMRGMLIDRAGRRAWRIRDVREQLDCGNYLRHAVFDGMVSKICWVHDSPGGRMYDVNSVKYTTDATAIPHRLWLCWRRAQAVPLDYTATTLDRWTGLAAGDFMDIDWDTFAERTMRREDIAHRVERFFDKPIATPLAGAAVCYSPHHSLDSRGEFEAFCERLAGVLGSRVERIAFQPTPKRKPLRTRLVPRPIYSALQSQYYRIMLGLKRIGIE